MSVNDIPRKASTPPGPGAAVPPAAPGPAPGPAPQAVPRKAAPQPAAADSLKLAEAVSAPKSTRDLVAEVAQAREAASAPTPFDRAAGTLGEVLPAAVDTAEADLSDRSRRAANLVQGVPVFGAIAQEEAWAQARLIELSGGMLKGAGAQIAGIAGAVRHPLDTLKGLYSVAEHVPMLPANPLRVLSGAYDVAFNGQDASRAMASALNPREALRDDAEFGQALLQGIVAPYKQAMDAGKPAEALGRGVVDVGSLFIGGSKRAGASPASAAIEEAPAANAAAKSAEAVQAAAKAIPSVSEATATAQAVLHRGTTGLNPQPLFGMLERNDTAGIQKLMASGFDLNAADEFGQTALHKAALRGRSDQIQMLIAGGADPLVADARNRTALFWAAARNEEDAARTLLAAGSPPNLVDALGNGPVDVALLRGNPKMAELLEAHGGLPNGKGPVPLVDGKLEFGHPSLQLLNDEVAVMHDLSTPFMHPMEQWLEQAYYGKVFDDPDLLARNRVMVEDWSSNFSVDSAKVQDSMIHQHLRDSWGRVLEGKEPRPLIKDMPDEPGMPDPYLYVDERFDQDLADSLSTRQQRWQALSTQTGIPVPEKFQLYRGVCGDDFVGGVAKAWADPSTSTMTVPSLTLTSWSLDRQAAEKFAYRYAQEKPSGVVFEAEIPFDATVLDKWADDGHFMSEYHAENEVVVGTSRPDSIVVPKDRVSVLYDGTIYAYDQRQALIDRWNAGSAP